MNNTEGMARYVKRYVPKSRGLFSKPLVCTYSFVLIPSASYSLSNSSYLPVCACTVFNQLSTSFFLRSPEQDLPKVFTLSCRCESNRTIKLASIESWRRITSSCPVFGRGTFSILVLPISAEASRCPYKFRFLALSFVHQIPCVLYSFNAINFFF